ncbi:MAG: hypothetical protein ACI9VN_003981 [Patescibacteria group bacterium]|jgi:hypothetical protein
MPHQYVKTQPLYAPIQQAQGEPLCEQYNDRKIALRIPLPFRSIQHLINLLLQNASEGRSIW